MKNMVIEEMIGLMEELLTEKMTIKLEISLFGGIGGAVAEIPLVDLLHADNPQILISGVVDEMHKHAMTRLHDGLSEEIEKMEE